MTLARLVSSSLGAAPCSSDGAWRWMCSDSTGDTFTPGCLNQWGQPIPGNVEPCWDRLTPRRDRVAWPGEGTWRTLDMGGRVVPRACYPAITPSPCCCCKSCKNSSNESTNVIPRHPAGRVCSGSPTKGKPIKALQPGVPMGRDPAQPAHDWVCRGPPRLCPHARFALSLFVRLPAELGQTLGNQGVVRPIAEQPHVLVMCLSLAVPSGQAPFPPVPAGVG